MSDSDSEIECWDGVKSSASVAQPLANVPVDTEINKADTGLGPCKIGSPSGSFRKRKRSDVFPDTQGSLSSRRSPSARTGEGTFIDLTDENNHVDDIAAKQESSSMKNENVDNSTNQESQSVKPINLGVKKRAISRKSVSSSVSDKRGHTSLFPGSHASSRQASSAEQNVELIDLTEDTKVSLAGSLPLASSASSDDSDDNSTNADFHDDDSDEDSSRSSCIDDRSSHTGCAGDSDNLDFHVDDSDKDSSRLSRSSGSSSSDPTKKKESSEATMVHSVKEIRSEDSDIDSGCPSLVMQQVALHSSGDSISEGEFPSSQRPRSDHIISPIAGTPSKYSNELSNTSDTSVSDTVAEDVMFEQPLNSDQHHDIHHKNSLMHASSPVAKRVIPRKSIATSLAKRAIPRKSIPSSEFSRFQTTELLADVDMDTDWDTDASDEVEKEDDDEQAGVVTSVCKASGPTGLPIRYFSVYGGKDETLYDFRVFVEKSGIPNAGMGAFLTYMGARKLNTGSEIYKVCDAMLSDCHYREEMTMAHLVAVMPDGRTKGVALTGDNLHGNYNCVYWPRCLPNPIKALIPGTDPLSTQTNAKTINVKIVGESIEAFQELKDRPTDGIGHLGMYQPGDYEHVSGVCCNQNFCIELDAPYAPLGPTDRKMATLFDIKSFLFNNEPAAWAFDVAEKIMGQNQVCDITDDTTGEPHVYARKEIPMYVNEVGHSGLKENVIIRDTHNRTTKYFVRLNESMEPGATIELLTNYGKQYEDVRVRKGYGLKSIHRQDKTDDDMGAKLKRNFHLRSLFETTCMTLSLPDLNRVSEYICNQIWVPLSEMVKQAFSASDYPNSASRLSAIQWIAFLRLFWFRNTAERRLTYLAKAHENQPMAGLFCGGLIKACSNSLQKIQFPASVSLSDLLNQLETGRNLTMKLRCVYDAITQEFTEEFYYELREYIRHPFCSEMWCPLGIKVMRDLGSGFSRLKLKAVEQSRKIDGSELETLLGAIATKFRRSVEDARVDDLCFSSGTSCERLSFNVLQRILNSEKVGKSASWIENNDKMPKALHALAHTWFSGKHTFNQKEDVLVPSNKKFLVFCGTEDVGSLKSFVAEAASWKPNQTEDYPILNRTYYKIWQIAYVLVACARHHLVESNCDRIEAKISNLLGIERALIAYACREKMKVDTTKAAYLLYPEAKKSAESLFRSRVRGSRENKNSQNRDILKDSRKRSKNKQKSKADERPPKKRSDKTQKPKSSNGYVAQGSRPPAKQIYEGPPQIKLEYAGQSMKWPEGWIQRTFQRQTGDSKGQTDYYFYSPQLHIKLRSKKDVFRFLEKLNECGGDESKIRFKSA